MNNLSAPKSKKWKEQDQENEIEELKRTRGGKRRTNSKEKENIAEKNRKVGNGLKAENTNKTRIHQVLR